jgi:aquaporin Z
MTRSGPTICSCSSSGTARTLTIRSSSIALAIILFMGAVSGAHLNPGVSLAFAVRGDFPWKRGPGYIIMQLLRATLACLFLLAVFGNVEHLGATLPGPGYHDWQALLMEIALTAVLVSVIASPPRAPRTSAHSAPLGSAATSPWPGCGRHRSAARR